MIFGHAAAIADGYCRLRFAATPLSYADITMLLPLMPYRFHFRRHYA